MFDWRTGLRFRLILTVLMALLPVFGLFAYFAALPNCSETWPVVRPSKTPVFACAFPT